MLTEFAETCVATLRSGGIAVGEVVDTGAQNCVVVDAGRRIVFRFPRYEPQRVLEVAGRHRRARDLGLPAPEVLDVHAGGPGSAHVVLRRLPGTPLQELLPHLSDAARRRAAGGIAELLLALRGIGPDRWPFPAPTWSELWSQFAGRARAAQADGRTPVDARDIALAVRAQATAAAAPTGLVHGDLAWGNILFDPDGRVQAILDWDFAVIGDPAVDVAAVLMHIPPEMVAEFHRSHAHTPTDLRRFDDYLATWPLQHRLWAAAEPAV